MYLEYFYFIFAEYVGQVGLSNSQEYACMKHYIYLFFIFFFIFIFIFFIFWCLNGFLLIYRASLFKTYGRAYFIWHRCTGYDRCQRHVLNRSQSRLILHL